MERDCRTVSDRTLIGCLFGCIACYIIAVIVVAALPRETPPAVDGQWSEWTNGTCSVKCGEGITIRSRQCSNPYPQNGGRYCEGTSFVQDKCTGIQACNGTVAFSVYMSDEKANQTKYMTFGSKIIFDKVITNENEAYKVSDGTFIPPTLGLYAFTWTICVDARVKDNTGYGEFTTELMYGSNIIGVLLSDTEIRYDDVCSTGFVIQNVQFAAKEIYLRVMFVRQGKILSKDSISRTTFSGWRIS